jgi:DEAD/DEAH box helicase domain-containing protein
MRSLAYLYKENKIVYQKVLPSKPAEFGEYKFENPKLKQFLKNNNIRLYSHQAEAIKHILENKNVVITTATASGKSYIYIFSILEKLYRNPDATSIIVFPLKALARDQFARIREIIFEMGINASVEIYDGDTPQNKRKEIKKNPPNFLITTPDMLNVGILPYHQSWSRFFDNLEFVVLDEIHAYRGILGSHVANILRRLKRISNFYRFKTPIFIMNSATIHNPKGFASKLIGEEENTIIEISKSGASAPEREILILNNMVFRETAEFLASTILEDISTIVFVDSRKEAELLSIRVKDTLKKWDKEEFIDKVSSYRSGYTPEERREIEFKLKTKNILCVISTSALEMGIDIGDIENCYLVGYPGTLAQLWQRFGRAGRRDKKAYNIFAPKKNALDQYFVKNPEELFNRDVEEPIINPSNRYILKKHLPVMAKEIPIRLAELKNNEKEVAKELLAEKRLRYANGYLYPTTKSFRPFSIRSTDNSFKIIDFFTGKIIGDISGDTLIYETHYGAIYLHNGEKYIVRDIDFNSYSVLVEKTETPYISEPLKDSYIDIISIQETKKIGKINLYKGKVKARTEVFGYTLRDIEKDIKIKDIIFPADKILSREFETIAFWFTMPNEWFEKVVEETTKLNLNLLKNFLFKKKDFTYSKFINNLIDDLLVFFDTELFSTLVRPLEALKDSLKKEEKEELNSYIESLKSRSEAFLGALHGVEHALIGIYPLFAMNDRWDIGGLSTPNFPDFMRPTIFIFDGYEGGIGYAEVGFEKLPNMIDSVHKTISKCKCINGCPSCIYSPKCGNANDHLDKRASIILARKLLRELRKE